MHLYKVLNEPTVARLSIPFNLGTENGLLVVRGTDLLQLFRFVPFTAEIVDQTTTTDRPTTELDEDAVLDALGTGNDSFIGTEVALQAAEERTTDRFVLVGEWHLSGYITDLHSLTVNGYPEGCIAVSFKHAKLVVMQWDGGFLRWLPLSIHFYEKNLLDSHFFDAEFDSYFSVDPQSTCICYVYQPNNVAILPFKTDEILEDTVLPDGQESSLFMPSFLITASQLDESISHIIKLAFLPEYREPTLAIIFEPTLTWTGTLPKYKDTVRYLVLSLDVQQKSSVVIASVTGLPHDVDQIYPLAGSIGGSILIGANHLFHVDSAGSVNGVMVNKYSSLISKISAADQSELDIRLEGSKFVSLGTGGGLLILENGTSYYVEIRTEGRRVLGIKLTLQNKGNILNLRPSTACNIGTRGIFLGSKADDAKFLKWKHKGESINDGDTKKEEKVAVKSLKKNTEKDDNYDELDDLYNDYDDKDAKTTASSKNLSRSSSLEFLVHDELPNYGPINSLTLSWPNPYKASSKLSYPDPSRDCYDIVTAVGAEDSGGLCIFNRSVRPTLVTDFRADGVQKMWTLASQSQAAGGANVLGDGISAYDNYLVCTGASSTSLYKITDTFEDITMESDIVSEGKSLVIGTLLAGSTIIQVYESGVVFYDSDLNKIKEIELRKPVKYASICDPYVLVHFKAGGFNIYKSSHDSKTGHFSLDKQKNVANIPTTVNSATMVYSTILTSVPKKGTKRKRNNTEKDISSEPPIATPLLILVQDDKLILMNMLETQLRVEIKGVRGLPNSLESVIGMNSVANGVAQLTNQQQMPAEQQSPIIKSEIIRLGDNIQKDDYLVLMNESYDIALYRLIIGNDKLRLIKEQYQPSSALIKQSLDDGIEPQIVPFEDVGDYWGVVITGSCPLIIFKTAQSRPRLHRFTTHQVFGFTGFHTDRVFKGFAYSDNEGVIRVANLDVEFDYGNSLPAKQIKLGSTIMGMCYHEMSNTYIVGTAGTIPFNAVGEDGEPLEFTNEELPKALSFKSQVKLISPLTWTVIDEIELEENELVTSVKSLVLETDGSKQKREVIAFTTSFIRGEDLASKGCYYVQDVVDIVPEPGRPETNHKFKEINKENVKAAATCVATIEGYLLVAQGQKIVVRSLAEDNSLIPVAFIDVNIYVSDAKSVKNMVLLADTLKSIWLVGFGEEPYRMTLIGKDYMDVEVTSADFSVIGDKLFTIVADASKKLHILQYDPEDPTSLHGQKLVRRSEFFTGKISRAMVMIPVSTSSDNESQFVPLIGSDDGSISLMLSMPEKSYRTLFAVQQQITEKDWHNFCLNPRGYRALMSSGWASQAGTGTQVARQVIDYDVVGRFATLSIDKQYVYSRRLGIKGLNEVWECLKNVEKSIDYI